MTIKVKTLWQGKVGVNEKYLDECQSKGEPLVIEHDGRTMTIEAKEIRARCVGRSDVSFKDRFSQATYWLFYFNWKPDPLVQPSLI